MNMMRRSLLVPALMAMLLAAGVAVYEAGAQRHAMGGTSVATVRLQPLVEKLELEARNRKELEALRQRISAEEESRVKKIEDLQKQAIAARDAGESAEAIIDQFELERLRLQAWRELSRIELLTERSLRIEKLFDAISKTVKQMASESGYDVVIVDDSGVDLLEAEDPKTGEAVRRARMLLGRRLVYVNPSVDITEELTVRMNNAFANAPASN